MTTPDTAGIRQIARSEKHGDWGNTEHCLLVCSRSRSFTVIVNKNYLTAEKYKDFHVGSEVLVIKMIFSWNLSDLLGRVTDTNTEQGLNNQTTIQCNSTSLQSLSMLYSCWKIIPTPVRVHYKFLLSLINIRSWMRSDLIKAASVWTLISSQPC